MNIICQTLPGRDPSVSFSPNVNCCPSSIAQSIAQSGPNFSPGLLECCWVTDVLFPPCMTT